MLISEGYAPHSHIKNKRARWHFGDLGDTDKINNKIKVFAHEEYSRQEFTNITKSNRRHFQQ